MHIQPLAVVNTTNTDRAQLEALHNVAIAKQPEPVPLMAAFQALSEWIAENRRRYYHITGPVGGEYTVILYTERQFASPWVSGTATRQTLPDAIFSALGVAKEVTK
jgi:hypothetical protein